MVAKAAVLYLWCPRQPTYCYNGQDGWPQYLGWPKRPSSITGVAKAAGLHTYQWGLKTAIFYTCCGRGGRQVEVGHLLVVLLGPLPGVPLAVPVVMMMSASITPSPTTSVLTASSVVVLLLLI